MAGFDNDVIFGANVDFRGVKPVVGQIVSDGQILIGSTAAPHIKAGSLGSSDGSITWSVGSGTITGQVSGGTTVGKTITGDSGGALSPTAGNWNIVGSGSITTVGSASTLTTELTGLTNHNILVGAGTTTITKVAPSATSGVPLISQGSSSDPTFGTAVVAGGGTGVTSATAYAVLCGGTTSTSPFQSIASVGTSGQVLTSNGAAALPTFQAVPSPIITTFASSGSWSINANTKIVEFFIWAGGAGGGSGRCGNTGASGGGGGGGPGSLYYFKTQASLLTGSPYTVTVGAGGNGGSSVNAVLTPGNPGDPGGVSSVGTVLLSSGGTGGGGGSLATATGGSGVYFPLYSALGLLSGGNGTTTSASTLAAAQYAWGTGGGGAAGFTTGVGRTGTAGANIIDASAGVLVTGGTAGNTSGTDGGNGNSPSGSLPLSLGGTGGGGGGCDGTSVSGKGGNGAIPSGGGGGGAGALSSTPSGAGGNGAKGQIIIIEYI